MMGDDHCFSSERFVKPLLQSRRQLRRRRFPACDMALHGAIAALSKNALFAAMGRARLARLQREVRPMQP